jgi:hypothetical protein
MPHISYQIKFSRSLLEKPPLCSSCPLNIIAPFSLTLQDDWLFCDSLVYHYETFISLHLLQNTSIVHKLYSLSAS